MQDRAIGNWKLPEISLGLALAQPVLELGPGLATRT
jgi:hypothetical protein